MAICRVSAHTHHCGSPEDILSSHKLQHSHMREACSPIAPQQLGTAQLPIAVDYFLAWSNVSSGQHLKSALAIVVVQPDIALASDMIQHVPERYL